MTRVSAAPGHSRKRRTHGFAPQRAVDLAARLAAYEARFGSLEGK
jgi:hypothetical protein